MERKPAENETLDDSAQFDELLKAATNHSRSWFMHFFPNLRDAAIRWTEDDASSLAASVAYYLALSLFPMMLLLTSGIGLLLQFTNVGRNAESKILSAIELQTTPEVKLQVEQVLEQLRNHSIVTGPFGLIAAILAAIGVFAQIDRGFDKIFRIPQKREATFRRTLFRVVRHRLFAFVMLICVGGAILTVFAGNTMVSQLRSVTGSTVPSLKHAFGVVDFTFEFLTNSLLFGLVYRWLPKKKVCWTDAIRGGVLAGVVWEIGRTVLGMFLIGMRYTTAYGAIGSFIAILLWCYYGISILFFGAEYVQVLERKRDEAINSDSHSPMTTTNLTASGKETYYDGNRAKGSDFGQGTTSQVLLSRADQNTMAPEIAGLRSVATNTSSLDRRSETGRELPLETERDIRIQPRRSRIMN